MPNDKKNNSSDWVDIDDSQNPFISQSTSASTDLVVPLNEGTILGRDIPNSSGFNQLVGRENFNNKNGNKKP